ncbi:hemerythrin domain-containing protein [Nocardioides marmorisolisilvae]|uniref:Cation-binding protein n=1 Tax=Nocardioides marmorisolisilvae TaxID=1542737 RepID=A0A3N0DU96_9ACTN|nr:hemerythrin domain-containing protein [Nocardioides marmorisolisilvae]RNL78973.1 cation-binding protein [Nocardioides marmorisolisilvae]
MTDLDLTLPSEGDVVDLILADHRRFEELLRDLRDSTSDRAEVRHVFATLHVAHAEAEEAEVYPTLRHDDAIDQHEADHGREEHAEGNQALLDVLEVADVQSEEFDDKLEELAKLVNHHLTEEELTILNPAREDVDVDERARLGAAFLKVRNAHIEDNCGTVENLRAVVAEARDEGFLDG